MMLNLAADSVLSSLNDMQVIDLETAEDQELEDLLSIVLMIQQELRAGRSYEHMQASKERNQLFS